MASKYKIGDKLIAKKTFDFRTFGLDKNNQLIKGNTYTITDIQVHQSIVFNGFKIRRFYTAEIRNDDNSFYKWFQTSWNTNWNPNSYYMLRNYFYTLQESRKLKLKCLK